MTLPPLPADLSLSASPATDPPRVVARTAELLAEHQRSIWSRTDRLFAHLMMFQWLGAIILASFTTPRTWSGQTSFIHPHVWAALFTGAAIAALPIAMAALAPGRASTRQAVAVGQLLMASLLIHLSGGRIETHFHIFGSLAFLAFYRDWRVLVTGTVIVVLDHVIRGEAMPQSIYGVGAASIWRTLEHAGWVVFLDIFLLAACVRGVREMRGIARNRALLEASLDDVEKQVEQRTAELRDAQQSLVKAARSAGMAEIATSVLHNVGNVLNSVNISATLAADRLRQSEVGSLGQVSDLIAQHQADLGDFLTNDERGQMVPGFIAELSGCLKNEHDAVLAELASLTKGVDHIKQIVAAQQSMAKRSTVRTHVDPRSLLEAAVNLVSPGQRQGIEFVRKYGDDVPASVMLDEHKVMQILLNLVTNACQASVARPGRARQVTLALDLNERGSRLRMRVADNGVGIAPEHLSRMFSHGFTTKKDGHGFGLHGAANAAREMNGHLSAASEGLNLGATFTLDLPLDGDAAPQDAAAQHDGIATTTDDTAAQPDSAAARNDTTPQDGTAAAPDRIDSQEPVHV